ncbi:MAG: hypothetical protein KFF50_06220, partial [Desulfatitalea sp.]|nr:hypothetical protein [Desulfatitalea sp.]
MQSSIVIRGARQNNLKGLDLDIPLNRITVITGVSGSGKSSLAFDTLYAEGQRRYVETFSPYARQFMDRMDRPRVDTIVGVPPAIAIDRKDPVRTSRSSVGTMTELTDYVKLLFARQGVLHCDGCGQPVQPDSPERIWQAMLGQYGGQRLVLTFPYSVADDAAAVRKELLRLGYDRVWGGESVQDLNALADDAMVGTLNMVADRLVLGADQRQRVIDSLESAQRIGGGQVDAWPAGGARHSFSDRLHCPRCDITYTPPLPNLFSFNSPLGACDTCRGFGRVIEMDLDLIIPDPGLSLNQGAIKPWGGAADKRFEYRDLRDFCRRAGIPMDKPFKALSAKQRRAVIEGNDDYYGIRGFFKWLEGRTYKMHVRVFLSRYRSYDLCPECHGARFKPEALRFRIAERTIAAVYALNVDQAL